LRNYLGLSPEPRSQIEIDGRRFAPLGGGSGLRGLPGDFTPPSRFVRAVALTASVRPLETTQDAIFEAFRILDSFNIPVGATAGADKIAREIESATQITTVSDLKNLRIYFHTMSDRQVRMLDLNKIDFSKVRHQLTAVGASRQQSVTEVTIDAQ
jgi:choloylglycine hydrolase